jgi:hypothetical protein
MPRVMMAEANELDSRNKYRFVRVIRIIPTLD